MSSYGLSTFQSILLVLLNVALHGQINMHGEEGGGGEGEGTEPSSHEVEKLALAWRELKNPSILTSLDMQSYSDRKRT